MNVPDTRGKVPGTNNAYMAYITVCKKTDEICMSTRLVHTVHSCTFNINIYAYWYITVEVLTLIVGTVIYMHG